MPKIWLEIELQERVDALIHNVIDAVWHVPGVSTVVLCQHVFPSPPAVDETTRRPREGEPSAIEFENEIS